jgi:15-cis-phytoene synthase
MAKAGKAAPAVLPAALCELYLRQMEKPDYDPLTTIVEIPQWRRQWRLWRAARKIA